MTDFNSDQVFGDILSKTSITDVKETINLVNPEALKSTNIKTLCSSNVLRNELIETSKFLETLQSEYPSASQHLRKSSRSKQEHATDIVNYLQDLFPQKCLVCSELYIPASVANDLSIISCYICSQKSHAGCYDGIPLDTTIGVVYVCTACSVNKPTPQTNEESNESIVISGTEKTPTLTQQIPQIETQTTDSDHKEKHKDGDTTDNSQNKSGEYKEIPICQLYTENRCPHGINGNKLIGGARCSDSHPRRCYYFSKFGPSACKYKDRCRFFHPHLCENSVKLKMCLNKDCRDIHLRHTKRQLREEKWSSKNPNPKYQQPQIWGKSTQEGPSIINPWISENTNTKPTEPNTSNQNNSNNFLTRYLEQIKADLQKSMSIMINEAITTQRDKLNESTHFQINQQHEMYRNQIIQPQQEPVPTSQQTIQPQQEPRPINQQIFIPTQTQQTPPQFPQNLPNYNVMYPPLITAP